MINKTTDWLWGLLLDKRFWANVGIGLPLTAINFWLVTHLVNRGYNSFWTNLTVGLIWAGMWYGINRSLLFKRRRSRITSSARRSFAWWLATFGLHQVAFLCAVSLLGLPFVEVRASLLLFGLLEFLANYWFKDKKVFVPIANETAAV